MKHSILKMLEKQSMPVEQVVDQLSHEDKDGLLQLIRLMLDNQELQYDRHGRIMVQSG